jgi:hypothetical protein
MCVFASGARAQINMVSAASIEILLGNLRETQRNNRTLTKSEWILLPLAIIQPNILEGNFEFYRKREQSKSDCKQRISMTCKEQRGLINIWS